jgi:hypothetical protein
MFNSWIIKWSDRFQNLGALRKAQVGEMKMCVPDMDETLLFDQYLTTLDTTQLIHFATRLAISDLLDCTLGATMTDLLKEQGAETFKSERVLDCNYGDWNDEDFNGTPATLFQIDHPMEPDSEVCYLMALQKETDLVLGISSLVQMQYLLDDCILIVCDYLQLAVGCLKTILQYRIF